MASGRCASLSRTQRQRPRIARDRSSSPRPVVCSSHDALAHPSRIQFIESGEAVRIVEKAYNSGKTAREAAHGLIIRAALRWAQKEGSYRDDTTVIVVYLPTTVKALGLRS